MSASLILYSIGFLGFILNRRHVLLALLSIEIMLLAATLVILLSVQGPVDNDLLEIDAIGLGIYSIVIAGAESAIGLALVVSYNRSHGQIYLN